MKVSLNWLKQYLDINLDAEKVAEVLTDIGLEVEGMEQVESIKGGLDGVVVGEVVECGPHPNADRLSLTRVKVGNGENLSIVCGAPNVARGQRVMVATVGTTLYPTGSDEALKIKKGKIRGEVSAGMICAEDELGIGHDHDGILVLPEDTPIGTTARDYFNIETDTVYEIGLTPNRSDATNHMGVARDLAAALAINYGGDGKVHLPDVSHFSPDRNDKGIEVVVEDQRACPRYAGLVIEELKIGDSPDWLKKRLTAIGVRSISNVVDVTNFILHELGQPLHAFDLDKVAGEKIIVKTLPAGTLFVTLDEQERRLHAEDLMICNGEEEGLCIGGVFGGMHSGVSESTTRIFLESAHFDAQSVRRTSMRHNLRTDAAKVFEKGSDPDIVVYALKRAAELLRELAGGKIVSEVVDLYPVPIEPQQIVVEYAYVNRLIGVDIPREKVHDILQALDMELLSHDASAFTVKVPTNKADVTRPADVVEEILRIYGFNQVPLQEEIKTAMTVGQYPDPTAIRNTIGDMLAANGFHEMMAVSLSQSRYYEQLPLGLAKEDLIYINNTSNVHLDIMRPDMLISGLEAVQHNQNRQQNRVKFFEFGRSYRAGQGEQIVEREYLSLLLSGERWQDNWLVPGERLSDFYTTKAFCENVLQRLGIASYQESETEDAVFSYGLKWHRGPKTLVAFGKVAPAISKGMDIRSEVFYALFDMEHIFEALKKHSINFQELSKFPSTRRDLALVIDNSVRFSDIKAIASKVGKKLITDIRLFDVYENEEQLGPGLRSYAVAFTFEDPNKTLKDKEVDKVMQQIIKQCEAKLNASIRQ